jgi:hypothetical protein
VQQPMKRFLQFVVFSSLTLTCLASKTSAQSVNNYILQSPSLAQAQTACQTYGLTMVSTIRQPDTYLVQLSAAVPFNILQQWVQHDPNVQNLQPDNNVSVPENSATTAPYIPPMPVTDYVTDGHMMQLYGNSAWVGYVQQPAVFATNLSNAVQQNNTGNNVTVAVIDTGIDQNNPILAPVLVSGYDFTRNTPGYASDLADINQATAALLETGIAFFAAILPSGCA